MLVFQIINENKMLTFSSNPLRQMSTLGLDTHFIQYQIWGKRSKFVTLHGIIFSLNWVNVQPFQKKNSVSNIQNVSLKIYIYSYKYVIDFTKIQKHTNRILICLNTMYMVNTHKR